MTRMFVDGFYPEVTKEDVARANRANLCVLFEQDLSDIRFEREQTMQRCCWLMNELWARFAASLLAPLESPLNSP